MTTAGGLMTTTRVNDLMAMTRWQQVEWLSQLIAENEGHDAGRAWLLMKLFAQISRPMALRVTIANTSSDRQDHENAVSWWMLRKMTDDAASVTSSASRSLPFADVSLQLARNEQVLAHLNGEAVRAMGDLPPETIQYARQAERFQSEMGRQQHAAEVARRPAAKRTKARNVPRTYEDAWMRHGVSSAREVLSRDFLPEWIAAATNLASMDRLPAPLRSAVGEWRDDLVGALAGARS